MSRNRWLMTLGVGLMILLSAMILHREAAYNEVMFAELDRVQVGNNSVRLYYEIGGAIEEEVPADDDGGRAVVRIDDSGRAHFVRVEDWEELDDDEHLLQWRRRDGRVVVGPGRYRVERGTGRDYADAEYVELRVTSRGAPYAALLRDGDLEPILDTHDP